MNKRSIFSAVAALALLLVPGMASARMYNGNTGRFMTMDTYEGDQENPLSLHKYLFVSANPANGIDPNGHLGLFKYTREFGNWAHRVIEDEYQAEHPGAICGTTTGILGTGLKPDICDGINRTFMEIKPLSLSGVAKGAAQIAGYEIAFRAFNLGYSRGTWPDGVRPSNVGPVPIMYFNVQGVIFYTDAVDDLDDIVTICSFTLARQFITSNAALITRTLIPSLVRISQIIVDSIPAIEADEALIY